MKPMQFAKRASRKVTYTIKGAFEEKKHQEISSKNDLNGYKRVYLVHIRKTGGTSLNNMFLSLSGGDPKSLHKQLIETPDHRILYNGLSYVGWNVRYINKGNYFYGFSHTPFHKLTLPKQTFSVSCFRDPVQRVLSHYNMLMDFQKNNIDRPGMAIEAKWLGTSFDDFLERIPQEHLLNQLYMFSEHYDISEAVLNVRQLSHYFFNDAFDDGVNELNKKTGLTLEPMHIHKTRHNVSVSEFNLTRLRDMLEEEYLFLEQIQKV